MRVATGAGGRKRVKVNPPSTFRRSLSHLPQLYTSPSRSPLLTSTFRLLLQNILHLFTPPSRFQLLSSTFTRIGSTRGKRAGEAERERGEGREGGEL